MVEIPLGQKESEILEFKGRDALKDLFSIGREVVAMLNAKGGEIWVGLGEEQGHAVTVESIERPELERQRVRDYLVDSIEPRLDAEEVTIEVAAGEADRAVLRLTARPRDQGRPYALLKQTGRHFLRRFEDRVVTMSREEVRERLAGAGPEDSERAVHSALEARKRAEGEKLRRLWMRVAPTSTVALESQSPRLEALLRDPGATGNRRAGVHLQAFAGVSLPVLKSQCLRGGGSSGATEICRDGEITSWVSLNSLCGDDRGRWTLWGYALLEYSVSVLRLARAVYLESEIVSAPPSEVVTDLALFGLSGLALTPDSPMQTKYRTSPLRAFDEKADFTLLMPLRVSSADLQNGDTVAFRLVRQVYEAFGWGEEEIPPEFSRTMGRLVLEE